MTWPHGSTEVSPLSSSLRSLRLGMRAYSGQVLPHVPRTRQADAIKWTCISQNFKDRRARAAHSD
jgi:hypothetical protein